MKVVHIECGLGNQMLDYCEYLALRHAQPAEVCYIETLTYDIPESEEYFAHWNGYELERVFGIKVPNIREIFTDEQWNSILMNVRKSLSVDNSWNWPRFFCEAFRSEGLELNNTREDLWNKKWTPPGWYCKLSQAHLLDTAPVVLLRRIYNYRMRTYKLRHQDEFIQSEADMLFYKGTEDALIGHRLSFQNRNNHIEWIDQEIRQAFTFPPFVDEKNRSFSNYIRSRESVSIHVRRGDYLLANDTYYRTGYFKRAVKYIKAKIQAPVFVFFSDPGSVEFCRENLNIFSLSKKDKIHFVDWNTSEESYRDMQLMSLCKHNIITNSSFGWWGAYLNENPNKITISPKIEMNTTHHF